MKTRHRRESYPLKTPLCTLLSSTGIASGSILLLALAQLSFFQSDSFLGAQAGNLSREMIYLYPFSAFKEAGSLFLICLMWILPSVIFIRHCLRQKAVLLRRLAPTPFIIWCLSLLAANIRYPALFEPYTGASIQATLYRLARYLNPDILDGASFLFIALCLLTFLLTSGLRKLPALLMIAAIIAIFLSLILPDIPLWQSPRFTHDARRPNILLLSVDSLRYDASQNKDLTPNLHMLRSLPETLTFHDHHIGVPRTFPSWLELLLGKYAAKTGVRHMFPSMGLRRQKMPGLVSSLDDAGYHCMAVSDFAGDIFPRFQVGFRRVDAPELSIPTLVRMGIDLAFPLFLPFILNRPGNRWLRTLRESPDYADPLRLSQNVLAHLSEVREQPFFMTAFFSSAHFPYAATWPWNLRYTDPDYPGPYYFKKNPEMAAGNTVLSEQDKAQVRGLYQGGVASADHAIGQILNWLKTQHVFDETLVIITADHGEELFDDGLIQGHGDHLRGEHVIRVPLIIKLPAHHPHSGGDIWFTSRSVDIMPTLLALADLPSPPGDGTDLSPWLPPDKRLQAPQLAAYSETGLWFSRKGQAYFQKERLDYPGISGLLNFDPGHSGDIVLNPKYESLVISAKHRSLIRGDYKLIYQPTHSGALFRLYHRRKDPENLTDLSRQESEQLEQLRELLEQHLQENERHHQFIQHFLVGS
ncbi:MAG: sulfatase-like hydrolase/transferase [Deltaproteobacteria bacterium]|nr:sulfatase-like hydrolase/transferase [Deltaproteobacteria bacterium]